MIRVARISPTLITSTLSWFDCTAAIVKAVSSEQDTARRLASTLMVVSYGRCSCTGGCTDYPSLEQTAATNRNLCRSELGLPWAADAAPEATTRSMGDSVAKPGRLH